MAESKSGPRVGTSKPPSSGPLSDSLKGQEIVTPKNLGGK